MHFCHLRPSFIRQTNGNN